MRERDLGMPSDEGLLLTVEWEDRLAALEKMRTGKAKFAALLIEGGIIPEEDFDYKVFTVAQSLGEPFLDGGETDSSQRVQTIIPEPEMANKQVSSSSREELYLHVENAGMPDMPDWVVIGCQRNNEQAETTLVDPVKVFRGLDPQDQELLRQSAYYIQEPLSFALGDGRQERMRIREHVPIFDDRQNIRRPMVLADFEAMSSDSEPHRLAFQSFLDAAREQALSITLKPGSVLVIRNTAVNNGASADSQRFVMALHGRKPFIPDWENPRILKRVFVRGR